MNAETLEKHLPAEIITALSDADAVAIPRVLIEVAGGLTGAALLVSAIPCSVESHEEGSDGWFHLTAAEWLRAGFSAGDLTRAINQLIHRNLAGVQPMDDRKFLKINLDAVAAAVERAITKAENHASKLTLDDPDD